ncbi:hypothetical protein [Streptomyces sp. NPDC090025]|uniref:hypothetical protein n=1 Tax=Streptomyces sp. NPDC090025 TaxID=3365922 RepID=UPI0038323ACF
MKISSRVPSRVPFLLHSLVPSRVHAVGLTVAALAATPLLALAAASPAAAGACDMGGGVGGSCSSRFEPTASNCEGIYGYLRSHGGNLGKMNSTFQTEWRQCAAGPIAGGFGKG